MRVVLISPYELGRQPFNLAEPAAWLEQDGFDVRCLDLSVERLAPETLAEAELVAIYLGMHTATRIAVEALPRIRALAPRAHFCAYGLYAPVNERLLRSLGIDTVLGGEFEPHLLSAARRMRGGKGTPQREPVVERSKIPFLEPQRSGLPKLSHYAGLRTPNGECKTVGFAETSRGCKHLCRHCPVVPVYQGKFRIVPMDIVLADIRNQVSEGAQHISFGDPDFFNGPIHALKVVHALHRAFPNITYDATIKIEHIIRLPQYLPVLRETGCLFVTSAVESVDDDILGYLDKGHTSLDFDRAVELLRQHDIALAPTFIPFTPWTTLEGYVELLQRLLKLKLVESVPPIQLAIRLLIPEGSYLLKLPGFASRLDAFDPKLLGYPWHHPDARVDALQSAIQAIVATSEAEGLSRPQIFARIWSMAHEVLECPTPELPSDFGVLIPHLTEAWYCCAEPTNQQLQSF